MQNEKRLSLASQAHPRRTILRAALGGGALTVSGLRTASGVPAAARWQTASATPPADAADEQVLRLQAGTSGSASFDFTPLSSGGGQENWQSLIRLPPMYFDVDFNLKPAIFDSWEPNEDMSVWTFTIDPRAIWSDGTPITAADVKGTWELMADPLQENSRIGGYLGNVVGFPEVLDLSATEASGLVLKDDRTLEVQLLEPDPIFHWRVATTHLTPVKIEDARNDPEFYWLPENNPANSGPYQLETWDPDGGTATLGKNPNWWMGEGQYLDRIEFRFVTDTATVALMVQNGELDATREPLPFEMKSEFPDFFRPIDAFGFNTFWLATTVEPTNDLNVRKALTLSVNFEDVFQAAFPVGGGTMATQLLDSDLPCIDEANSWYPYDPDAAQEALAASPYGSAENLPELRVTPRGSNPILNRALEAVVEFWRQNLGITRVEFQEQPEAFGADEERINLSRDDIVVRFPDAATYMWTAAHSAGPVASGDMMKGYGNPEVDRLIDQALTVAVEDEQRCELALEAQRLFLADYPVIFLGIEDTTLNAREYVQNYAKGPDRALIAPWNIYIAEH